jgi:hypothetical protein
MFTVMHPLCLVTLSSFESLPVPLVAFSISPTTDNAMQKRDSFMLD